jgi:hypothetical protein
MQTEDKTMNQFDSWIRQARCEIGTGCQGGTPDGVALPGQQTEQKKEITKQKEGQNMKRLKVIAIGLLAGIAVALPPPAQGAAGIMNSPHNFIANDGSSFVNGTNWYPNNNLCEVCHVVHKAPYSTQTIGPLWNHTTTVGKQYTPYTSPRLSVDGYPNGAQPGYASLACLSCHDGSIAINEQGGKTTTTGTALFAPSWAIIAQGGTDLSHAHPIGISYDTVLASGDTYFNPVTTAISDASGDTKTIAQELLFQEQGGADMIECASCHDIHQVKGASATASDSLKIGGDGVISSLCLTCHIK